MAIADTILSQLGGAAKLVAFTGAKDFFSAGDNNETLQFKIKDRKINFIEITLDADDTYSMKFQKIGRLNRKTFEIPKTKLVAEESGIYCDMLVKRFESITGLYLSF